jgi:hypothetical protein
MTTKSVRSTGPLFDGRAVQMAKALEGDIVDVVSKIAAHEVARSFRSHVRKPSGHYESTIAVSRVETDTATVQGMNSWYGPWLTGTGSRNESSTFKGYPHFPEGTRRTNDKAARVAGSKISIRVKAMN